MKNSDITDPVFRSAVEAIDRGDITALEELINKHPELLEQRSDTPNSGYFKNPYLLWFFANNPVRTEKIADNIVSLTEFIIRSLQTHKVNSIQYQLDYTLGLVATGRIVKECGVQIKMMNLLIKSGAQLGNVHGVLAHKNIEAAEYLIAHGAKQTLLSAVGLSKTNEIEQLLTKATAEEKQLALVAAAFFGNVPVIKLLLEKGIDPNAFPQPDKSDGFHSHATALHQAIASGSLEAVKLLIEAGADFTLKDKIYEGTAADWVYHLQTGDELTEDAKKRFVAIEAYLLHKK